MKTKMEAKQVFGTFGAGSIHVVGDGFHVRNLFPSNELGERISPFLLLDYAGPTRYAPTGEPRGVGEHPHRGFETVTIVHQGELEHRDSAGNSGRLGPGDVQWMTAASGIVHEEKHEREFAKRGGTLEMVQLWVNLPARFKMSAPRYQEIAALRIPSVPLENDAGRVRVIAGEFRGVQGAAKTFTPLSVLDAHLRAGGAARFEFARGRNASIVCLRGALVVAESATLHDAEMAVLEPDGGHVEVRATRDTTFLVLEGEPLGEPVLMRGPFVMNTGQEIYQALKDYQSGRMGHLD